MKNDPIPAEFVASLALTAIHWPSKFCCEMKPVNAVTMLTAKITTPTIQVDARPSRQPAMKYWPHRCSTMNTKKTWTDQRCKLFTKRPTPD